MTRVTHIIFRQNFVTNFPTYRRVSEQILKFLTAHQHSLGYLVPVMVGGLKKGWAKKLTYRRVYTVAQIRGEDCQQLQRLGDEGMKLKWFYTVLIDGVSLTHSGILAWSREWLEECLWEVILKMRQSNCKQLEMILLYLWEQVMLCLSGLDITTSKCNTCTKCGN